MKVWKKLVTTGISGAMVLAMALPAYAGQWQFDGPEQWQWKYIEDDGTFPVNNWKELDGKWYHFDENGYMDIGWHSYLETDTYLDTYDGSTMTKEVWRWYFFDDNGVMATQGEWEGGIIQGNGQLLLDDMYYWEYDSAIDYYRYLFVKNEAGFITDTPLDKTYQGTLAWKTALADQWYKTVWANGSANGEWKMDYQLPENWRTECPDPLLHSLIQCPWSDTDAGTYVWTDWYVDENSILHVAATGEYNLSYLENPELIPRKLYDRTTGIWNIQ